MKNVKRTVTVKYEPNRFSNYNLLYIYKLLLSKKTEKKAGKLKLSKSVGEVI
jgi:hypothetical protein